MTNTSTATEPLLALVVDDDPSVRRLCAAILQKEGWRSCEADDGAGALEMVAAQSPDVIIMDVKMPGMDGLEATRWLRQQVATEDIPVIMLSGMSDRGDIASGIEAGADEYLPKPLCPDEFTMRLRLVGRLRRAWRELRQSNETLGEQTRSLGVLLDLSCVLSRTENLTTIIQHTADHCAMLTFCRQVLVCLPDEQGGQLRVAGAFGIDNARCAGEAAAPDGCLVSGFQAARPIILNQIDEAHDWDGASDRHLIRRLPAAVVPLRAEGRPVGVLAVFDRPDGRPFAPREIEYLSLLCNQAASSIDNVMSRRARDAAHEFVVIALAKLAEHRDDDTGRHLDRVTTYCSLLAEELRTQPEYAEVIDAAFIQNIRLAAPLHDIGKVAIPDAILLRPGKLNEDEMAVMQTHVIAGVETIRSVLARAPAAGFLAMAEEMIHGHHEWWNGEGYPNRIRGTEIPLSARILAIADVYDALTTKRVYKNAIPHDRSVEIIVEHAGTQFDPQVVAAFLRCTPVFKRLAEDLNDDRALPRTAPPKTAAPLHGPCQTVAG